jgi:putative transposase
LKHKEPIAEHLLNREFKRDRPNIAWDSDLTYLRVKSHWVYLGVFIDLFNRKVVG